MYPLPLITIKREQHSIPFNLMHMLIDMDNKKKVDLAVHSVKILTLKYSLPEMCLSAHLSPSWDVYAVSIEQRLCASDVTGQLVEADERLHAADPGPRSRSGTSTGRTSQEATTKHKNVLQALPTEGWLFIIFFLKLFPAYV